MMCCMLVSHPAVHIATLKHYSVIIRSVLTPSQAEAMFASRTASVLDELADAEKPVDAIVSSRLD